MQRENKAGIVEAKRANAELRNAVTDAAKDVAEQYAVANELETEVLEARKKLEVVEKQHGALATQLLEQGARINLGGSSTVEIMQRATELEEAVTIEDAELKKLEAEVIAMEATAAAVSTAVSESATALSETTGNVINLNLVCT